MTWPSPTVRREPERAGRGRRRGEGQPSFERARRRWRGAEAGVRELKGEASRSRDGARSCWWAFDGVSMEVVRCGGARRSVEVRGRSVEESAPNHGTAGTA